MDAYAHMLTPGDTATVMATGRVRDMYTDGKGWGMAVVDLPGSASTQVLLPERPGIRLLAGDLTPTLLDALEDAIEHLGEAVRGAGQADDTWVAAGTLDRLQRYERARDALRGGFIDDEKFAGHSA